MWRHLFKEHILDKGIDYFITNRVGNVYTKDNIALTPRYWRISA